MEEGGYAVGSWAVPDTDIDVTEDFIVDIKPSET
jgi:hypothetical protein